MAIYITDQSPSNAMSTTQSSVYLNVSYFQNEADPAKYYRIAVSQNANPFVASIIDTGDVYMYPLGDAVYQTQYFSFAYAATGLAPGTYYWQAYLFAANGTGHYSGSPTAIRSFTINDIAPSATTRNPVAGSSISWPDTNPYPMTFQWNYSGQSQQTAFQLILETNAGVVIHDSGKVTTWDTAYTYNIPSTYRDQVLRWKVRVYNLYNTVSAYTGYSTFTMATPATVTTAVLPEANAVASWSGSSPYPFNVQWSYSGAGAQTAYRIIVERASDGAAVVDSGTVSSSAKSGTVNIPLTYRNVQLRWRVATASSVGGLGAYSANRNVTLSSPPTVNITAPTANQVLAVGTPSVSGTITIGAFSVNKIVASIWDGTTKVWEKTSTGTWANGAAFALSDGNFFLNPNITYTYRVEATDTQGTVSPTATQNFSVQYTSPATPGAVTVTTTNYAEVGYVSVIWPDTGRDADFYGWEVEREDTLLDDNGITALQTYSWKKVGVVYTPGTSYEFEDYLAPSNHSVRYRVRQVSLKFNTQVFGNYATSTSKTIKTGAYWLVAGINGDIATVSTYKITFVAGESFTEDVEESEYNIIGRGRFVETGTALGAKGQLDVKLRTNADGTARQKRLALIDFKTLTPRATLRNPFGDAYFVSVGNISISRIAGVGMSEFVDVTIPYTEVVGS